MNMLNISKKIYAMVNMCKSNLFNMALLKAPIMNAEKNKKDHAGLNQGDVDLMYRSFNQEPFISYSHYENNQSAYFIKFIEMVKFPKSRFLSIENALEFQGLEVKHKFIHKMILILSRSDQFTRVQEKYLNEGIAFWINVHRAIIVHRGDALEFKFVQSLMGAINEFLFMLNINKSVLTWYFRTVDWMVNTKKNEVLIGSNRCLTQFRILYDLILEGNMNLGGSDVHFLLYFITRFQIESFYHEKASKIYSYLFGLVKTDWYLNPNVNHAKTVIMALNRAPLPHPQLANGVLQIYLHSSNHVLKTYCMKFLIQHYYITKDNINQPQFMNVLIDMCQSNQTVLFKSLINDFYSASLWVEPFWLKFYQWAITLNNYQQINLYYLHVIKYLHKIDKNQIPELILKQGVKFDKFLKSKGIELDNVNVKELYLNRFNAPFNERVSCQNHITNSLRLINKAQVLTQQIVSIFMVDIIINKKYIIEINNTSHYKEIKGELILDLKSSFRKRILLKEGYKFRDIHVKTFTEANFSMLEELHQIIREAN